MTRKRCYLISAAVLAAFVGIALGVLAMLPARPGVTKANFERIKEGMTLAEVEALFGEPSFRFAEFEDSGIRNWVASNRILASVLFDPNGRVVRKEWWAWPQPQENLVDKIHRWLRLPK
jgi:hypothetical protein